jgi:hypothetical protein
MTARVVFVGLMLMGAPPVETTGAPACLSRAKAASMSRTNKISVTAPGSCRRRCTAFRSTSTNSTSSTPHLTPGIRAPMKRSRACGRPWRCKCPGSPVPWQRSGGRRRHEIEPEHIVIEPCGTIEVLNDRAHMTSADDCRCRILRAGCPRRRKDTDHRETDHRQVGVALHLGARLLQSASGSPARVS